MTSYEHWSITIQIIGAILIFGTIFVSSWIGNKHAKKTRRNEILGIISAVRGEPILPEVRQALGVIPFEFAGKRFEAVRTLTALLINSFSVGNAAFTNQIWDALVIVMRNSLGYRNVEIGIWYRPVTDLNKEGAALIQTQNIIREEDKRLAKDQIVLAQTILRDADEKNKTTTTTPIIVETTHKIN